MLETERLSQDTMSLTGVTLLQQSLSRSGIFKVTMKRLGTDDIKKRDEDEMT